MAMNYYNLKNTEKLEELILDSAEVFWRYILMYVRNIGLHRENSFFVSNEFRL